MSRTGRGKNLFTIAAGVALPALRAPGRALWQVYARDDKLARSTG
jgi:hypothetical protein